MLKYLTETGQSSVHPAEKGSAPGYAAHKHCAGKNSAVPDRRF